MKRIIGIVIAISLVGVGSAYALTASGTQGLTVNSGRTLTISVPAAITYNLTAPLATGDETIASSQAVSLNGNDFDNVAPATGVTEVPYITVSMSGSVTNASIKVTGITLSVEDTVTVAAAPADITLSSTAARYAGPNVNQASTYGKVNGTHNLIISKANEVPAGSYSLTITWAGNDGG